jgi:hypothetical protein
MRYRGSVNGPTAASAIAATAAISTTSTAAFAAKTSHQKEAKQ